MITLSPGVILSEGPGDEPQRCGDIGCPCVISRKLEESRQGQTLVFWCPSSRIAATLTPRAGNVLVLGSHYSGNL